MRRLQKQLSVVSYQFSVIFITLLLLLTVSCLLPTVILAVTNPLSPDEITNSITIPDSTVVAPNLRNPSDGAYTKNPFEPFSWQRSTSDTGIDHYTVYRDGVIVADNITHADKQATSIFSASVDSNYVYLTFKTALSGGVHTWRVIATGSQGITASSETWTFTVDNTIPDIILRTVDKNKMYWATHDPATIPPWEQRHLIVTTSNPLISGKVEANSNIKFSLVCPITPPLPPLNLRGGRSYSTGGVTCSNQSVTVFEADGNWEYRFRNLEKNVTYSVFISATDGAGNSNIFPTFNITYVPFNLVSFIKPTPVPAITSPSPTPPSPYQGEGRGEVSLPPPAPDFSLFPSSRLEEGRPTQRDRVEYPVIIPLGLLLHLAMTFYGAGIHLAHLPGFLFTLCFPFFGKKTYEIDPFFTTVTIFDPANLSHEFFSWVSNIKGKINLEFPKPQPQVFIQLTRPGYEKQSLLLATAAIPEGAVIKLKPKDHPKPLERVKTFSLALRAGPLIIADITSLIVLILAPSIPVAFYFGLALTLTFSEYIYPRLKISNS